MYKSSLDDIEKVIEQTTICGFVYIHFTPTTFEETIEKEMNPGPQDLLRAQEMAQFIDLLNGLSTQTLRELVVMFVIGRGNFEMEEWDMAMRWCEADVTEPAEYLFKNGRFLARWLIRFLKLAILDPGRIEIIG
jgi:hypothetical protein